jgi:hypothetical protein
LQSRFLDLAPEASKIVLEILHVLCDLSAFSAVKSVTAEFAKKCRRGR